jgi:hypothetical protein
MRKIRIFSLFLQRRRSWLLYNRIRHTREQTTTRSKKKIHQQQSALVSSERLRWLNERILRKQFFLRLLHNDMASDILNGSRQQKMRSLWIHFFRFFFQHFQCVLFGLNMILVEKKAAVTRINLRKRLTTNKRLC